MKAGDEQKAESFKRATATAVKAIGHRAELEVAFVQGMPQFGQERIKLPEPSPALEEQAIAELRGAADAAAVRLRYHDEALHHAHRPLPPQATSVFNILEQARCEALGARRLAGVGSNISAYLAQQCRQKGFRDVRSQADIPLGEALHLLAHERLSGQTIPAVAEKAVAVWRPLFDERLGGHLEKLRELLPDQRAFAAEVEELLVTLKLVQKEADDASTSQTRPKPENKQEPPPDQQQAQTEDQQEQLAPGSGDTEESDDDANQTAMMAQASEMEEDGEEQDKSAETRDAPHMDQDGFVTTYRVFSTAHDEIIRAQDLCPMGELQRLRRLLDYQVRHSQNIIIRLANKLQRRLMAKQLRAWEFDLEEGILDAARLARVVANPMMPLSFKMEKDTDFRDTVVSLLIDNSGSMRGRPITLAALSADIMARTLERCGVKTEILGFTTRLWKGGKSREQWVSDNKPAMPGRLNDIRHIIYKEADVPWRRAKTNLGLMLREGLLKENIDGEALLWAHHRLLARPEDRRILMVISDGAPVDDSTLSANPNNYLDLHLRSVIDWIEKRSPVELIAIGIGHDVTRYYKRAVTISDVEELGGTMTEQLAALFDHG